MGYPASGPMSASPMHTSLLLCSWPVTSLATPRRLPSAPEHRLCVALDPLAGLRQQQSGGCHKSRPPATSGAHTGASDLALEFLPPSLHPGSSEQAHCLPCLPYCLHVFVCPNSTFFLLSTQLVSFLPLQLLNLLSPLVSIKIFFSDRLPHILGVCGRLLEIGFPFVS